MKKYLYIFLIINSLAFSQENFKDIFLTKANSIEMSLQDFIGTNNYILFGTEYRLLIIVNQNKEYYELIYGDDDGRGYRLKDINTLNDKILKNIFMKKNYQSGYIDVSSDFYDTDSGVFIGLPSYFSYNTGFQNRYGEYSLTVLTSPVPIKKEVYGYILSRFLGIKQ